MLSRSKKLKIRIIFWSTTSLYIFIILVVLSKFLGNNTLNKLNENGVQYASMFPQGWAFFTRSVTSPSLLLYQVKSNRFYEVDLRAFQCQYAFGLSRRNRLRQIDLGYAITRIDNSPQTDKSVYNMEIRTGEDINSILRPDTLKYTLLDSSDKFVTLPQGKYLAVYKAFQPWSLMRSLNVRYLRQSLEIVPFEIKNTP
jgi:hypothetical protein